MAVNEDAFSNQRRKRRKVDKETQNGTEVEANRKGRPLRKAPLALLRGHTARVSAVVFSPMEENIAHSCGLDATIKSWDTERQLQISSLVSILI